MRAAYSSISAAALSPTRIAVHRTLHHKPLEFAVWAVYTQHDTCTLLAPAVV
jgi:hypothetical protein